ncbi:MAG: formate dehydrogenase accessory protein FdhE [bacterium]|nr:formate dehydrogenase accessory protein FdhE [bacterium]
MKSNSEYLKSIKNDVIKAGNLTEEFVDFYKSIFGHQEQYHKTYQDNFKISGFVSASGLPMIDPEKVQIPAEDKDMLYKGLEAFLEIITKTQSGLNFEPLLEKYKEDTALNHSIQSLLKKDFEQLNKISGELKIGLEEHLFVIINWLKPYFINLREQTYDPEVNPVNISDWHEPTCLFCGYYPDMSKIIEGKENVRVLHCGFCENEWQTRRLGCTVCKNVDHNTLGYYTYEDDPIYRVDYCDECKGYIKTLKIPKKYEENRYNLTVENIVTTFLDASTIDLGYTRP